jgi:acyl-CoA thioesterase-1
MRSPFLLTTLLLAACASTPQPLEEPVDVLILGDSISIGYTNNVRTALEGRATVVRPTNADGKRAQNCAGTNNGVEKLDQWLAIGDFDVIHFNFGLHDLKRVDPETGRNSANPNHPHQADPERYEAQLRDITTRIKATGARVIFATTTPVPEKVGGPLRLPEDAINYNAIALRVMEELDVPIDDLHAFAQPRLAELQNPRDVHFSPAGSQALGEEVARAILAVAGLGE